MSCFSRLRRKSGQTSLSASSSQSCLQAFLEARLRPLDQPLSPEVPLLSQVANPMGCYLGLVQERQWNYSAPGYHHHFHSQIT